MVSMERRSEPAHAHHFACHLVWTGGAQGGTTGYEHYSREVRADVECKPPLSLSAAPAFRGDPALHNPEDLLVAALSSCHFLSYAAHCARSGVHVVAYEDDATGTMDRRDGVTRFTEVVLRPRVTVAPGADVEKARALHERAHAICFIASSVDFDVRNEPTIVVAPTWTAWTRGWTALPRLGYSSRGPAACGRHPRVIHPRRPTLPIALALALLGCGRGAPGDGATSAPRPRGSRASAAPASAAPAPAASSATLPAASVSAVPIDPASPPPLPATFVGAKTDKACKAQTVELGGYQQQGEVALGGHDGIVAAAWRVRLPHRPQLQVAFASFDREGTPVARARGVGTTLKDVPPRVFASGREWTVVWYDDKGLAYARPHVEKLPVPETAHLGAVGPEVAADIALASSASLGGAVLATAPFGAGKAQLGLFLFAPADNVSTVKALGVTHHGKAPHRPALAEGPGGTFVLWDEDGALVASRFDAAGKEGDAICTIAPADAKREKREGIGVAAAGTGAVALWMEGSHVRTRALDAAGCPASPIWTVAEGRWASIAALDGGALAVWAAPDGRLLAARLQPDGSPPARGIDAAEGSSGIKDAPVVTAFGAGKVAFAWSEAQSAVEAGKRLMLRIVDGTCIP